MEDLKKPFRITIEHYDEKISVEINHSDVDIYEVADEFKKALLAAGFVEENIKEILKTEE